MGLLEEVGAHLASQSTRFVVGTNLFYNFMADEPNTATALYETGGTAPVDTFASAIAAWEQPRVQVVCRATSSTHARTNIDKAWKVFNRVANATLSGVSYLNISAVQSPFLLERDSRGRVIFACNFDVMRRTTST